ncbi:alpha/beta fold hydrolase [Fertoeibacter niger]|uniref:alpha/beta fold hydrolase n=1 Tax=Fertoeibacter niger TaxID=2656921 RepID=UPI001F4D05E4|nr:alpha/beta hydrolase [Fertoeibacter niger]
MALSFVLATLALGGCAAVVGSRAAEREAVAETKYPPTGQLIAVNGKAVHADVQGAGPDLILIHGASGNTRDFTFALVDQLKDRYRVISLDRPGMGWSDSLGDAGNSPLVQADQLIAAARVLGVRDPVVLGHSYGGAVAMAWALRDPGNTGALVVLSGATMPWPGGLGPQYAILGSSLGGATVVPLVTAFAGEKQAQAAIASIFEPFPPPAGYADYIGAGLTLRRASLRTNAQQVGGLKPYVTAMAENYPKLTLPVEIVHGDADTTVPLAIHGEPLSRLLPGGVLTVLPGAGHMPHHTHAAAVIAAIDRAAARR